MTLLLDARPVVLSLLQQHMRIPRPLVDTECLAQDLGLSSLDFFEFVMHLEDQFELQIPDEDSSQFLTVGACVQYVQGRLDTK